MERRRHEYYSCRVSFTEFAGLKLFSLLGERVRVGDGTPPPPTSPPSSLCSFLAFFGIIGLPERVLFVGLASNFVAFGVWSVPTGLRAPTLFVCGRRLIQLQAVIGMHHLELGAALKNAP